MWKWLKQFIKKRWYIILLLLLIAGFFVYRSNSSQNANEKTNPYKVKRQTLKETLSLSGKIDAEEKTTLRFQTSGRLSWVGVKEGDYVKKYQSIASLDQRALQKQLDKDLNDYLDTRWSFEQTKDNNNQGQPITTALQRILDKSQFGLNKSVIDVELQNLSLEYANLWTPIEGLVTRVASPFAGVNITPSQAEFDIVNPNTIYFSALADQTDIVKITNLKKGYIVFDSFPDKTVNGQITAIGFTPKNGETGTVYEVKLSLGDGNSDNRYRLGMTGDVEFVLKQKTNVLSVPSSYLKTENSKKYVYKKINDKKIKTFVTTGSEYGDDTEILDGLAAGDIVY